MASVIDTYVSAPWYLDHLRPIIAALGDAAGAVFEGRMLRARPTPKDIALVASYGDLKIARAVGYKRFVLAQHGAGQSYSSTYPSYPGGRDHADVGLFLVPNDHAAMRWKAAYPKARVAVVGCPKLETLPGREPGPGPVICISFHWDFRHAPETLSATREYLYVLKPLAELYSVIGHGHPKRRDLDRIYRQAGIEFVPDFDDVCRRADLYIADNSSTMFEFAATGRPVIVMNSRQYRPEANHGLRFWDAAGIGINVWTPRELARSIDVALECRPADVAAREQALDLVYSPRHATGQLAADAILAYAETPVPDPETPASQLRSGYVRRRPRMVGTQKITTGFAQVR